MNWWFRSPAPEESVRDPVHEEFFADDAIKDVCEALVREGIQNALDAGLNPDEPVIVRLGVLPESFNPAAAELRTSFMSGTQPHWNARGTGLTRPPQEGDPLRWILFEDFGTTGLTGDPSQAFPEDVPNPFFAFFRAEGYSEKSTVQRGRWGLGKFAFPRASRGRCFLGVTVRHDDHRRFLMGRCTLKSHRIDDNRYTPDGFFGLRAPNSPAMPFEDPDLIDSFSRAFGLSRDASRSGLSVVVPFVDQAEVKSSALLAAVLRGYWLAILSGQLEVRLVEEDANVVEITSMTIDDVLQRLPLTERDALSPLISLGRWGLQTPHDQVVTIDSQLSKRTPRWGEDSIPADTLELIRQRVETGRVKIRVSLSVRATGQAESRDTWFDVLLERTADGKGHKPLFLREGILISDVRTPVPTGWRCVVLIEHEPLATLLGDSENPAHTRWLKEGTHFKGKYVSGKEVISFVTTSLRAVVDRLSAADADADPSVLADVLSVLLPEDSGRRRRPERTTTEPTDSTEPDVTVDPVGRRFRLTQVDGGFSISGSGTSLSAGSHVKIRMAYDVRQGDALSSWQAFDFDVSAAPIRVQEQANVDVLERRENRVRLQILAEDFRFVLVGFDPWRDLKIDVRITNGGDE